MRNQESTKHDYGHGLLIAGAYGRMGCAILAAKAALRSGCGLVSVHLPSLCVDPIQAAFPEAMVSIDRSPTHFTTLPDHPERYTAIAVGPGIGNARETREALLTLPGAIPAGTPVILDADAINILSPLHSELSGFRFPLVLTPHAREYERMFGENDPGEMARKHNCIIVKKAHHTRVYSPDGEVYENHSGNAGMATAGSGDVLTGILLGMLCANRLHSNTFDITCRAVEIHGKLGDMATEKQSESSLIASDLVENLRYVSTDITSD